jgi:hypothetical protein
MLLNGEIEELRIKNYELSVIARRIACPEEQSDVGNEAIRKIMN